MTTEITVSQPEKELEFVPQFHAVAVNGTEMVQAKAGIQLCRFISKRSLSTRRTRIA
jgi:hypothetical protein